MGSLCSHYVVWQESGFRYFDELSDIDPEYSLEGLILKLKLPYFGHLMQRVNSLEKILMLGKIEGRMIRG